MVGAEAVLGGTGQVGKGMEENNSGLDLAEGSHFFFKLLVNKI